MNLDSIFEEVSKQMQGDFEKAREALSHAGLKGGANEETVKTFLRQYLPMTLELSTGMIVDSTGGTSRQIDIIVHDAAKTPFFTNLAIQESSQLSVFMPHSRSRHTSIKVSF